LTHWTLALVMLPCLWAVMIVTSKMLPLVISEGYQSWWLYLTGGLTYMVFNRWIHKPMWFYVLGHELTHAASGLLSGAKIHSLKAGSKGGEVRLSKTNAFVALSPYIFPFYTVLFLLIYALIRHWWEPKELDYAFQFIMGLTLAFH